jgi:hypothetical protein
MLNNGDNLEWYKKGTLNNDCGFYGPIGGVYQTQSRSSNIPTIGTSILVTRDNLNYYNFLDFYDKGYEPENLYCFQDYEGLSVSNENCREPYITNKYDLEKFYNKDEDLFMEFLNTNLYYSNTNNNTASPNDAKNWLLVTEYNNNEIINSGTKVYSENNNYLFAYEAITPGVTGEELSKLGVYYLYNKFNPVFEYRDYSSFGLGDDYMINANYYQNNWVVERGGPLANQMDGICQDSNFQYLYDISLSYTSDLTQGTSFYNFEIGINTKNSFEVGDYINPDFNLFNSILLQGVSVFNFNVSTGTDEITEGVSIFTDVNFTGASVGDLVCIAYNIGDDFFNDFFSSGNIYNYSFEVCKILKINTNTVNLKRNLLNYPIENRFYGNGMNYTAYRLDPKLDLKLLFKINRISDNTLFFNFNAFSLNIPNIDNIETNCQSRTAFSARIIKNKISIPSNKIDSIPGSLYLMKSPNENKVSSFVDLIVKQEFDNGIYNYYINEYKLDRYINNKNDGMFQTGDNITISFPSTSYNIPILGKNVFFQGILYDYLSTTDTNITELDNQVKKYNIDYVLPNLPENYSNITETLSIRHTTTLEIDTNGTLTFIDPSTYTNQYFQELESGVLISYNYFFNSFQNLFENQKNIDTASPNLVKMSLNSTCIYPDLDDESSYIIINNIALNEKPYGPSYLTDLVNSNDLNFDGYGTIISFEISQNLLNNKVSSGMIFESKSGFVFSISKDISEYQFKTLLRKSDLNTYTYSNDIIN